MRHFFKHIIIMKINKKFLRAFFVILACLQQIAYTWIAALKVMQHSDGHIVRLAGDIHLEGFSEDLGLEKAMKQEENFLIAIEQPLADFLGMSLEESECFVVEKIISDLLPVSHLFQSILLQGGIAAIPLITRLNVLAHSKINQSIKSLVACIDCYTLQPKIKIVPYDIRSRYAELCKMSFPRTRGESDTFYASLVSHKKLFENYINEQIDNITYGPMFSDFIEKKGYSLIKSLEYGLELERFFTYSFADFGYLVFIAQNTCKNITLFLGVIHCHNLVQDLEKVGYRIIFEKGAYDENDLCKNIIPNPRSQEEYQEFFAIGRT